MLRIELIITGEELFDGRVRDENSFFITSSLFNSGFQVTQVCTIGDDRSILEEVFSKSINRSDIVIISGGLGPTEDDRTSEILAKVVRRPLVRDKQAISFIEDFFSKRKLTITETNYKQADIPEGSEIITNKIGTAPGIHLSLEKCEIFALPGVPSELEAILIDYVLPYLEKKHKKEKQAAITKILKCFGTSESKIAHEIKSLYPLPSNINIGFQASFPEVHIIIRAFKKNNETAAVFQEIEKNISRKIEKYIFGRGQESFVSKIREYFISNKLSLAVAESCTGGLVSHLLTSEPGASDYFLLAMVTYANQSKEHNLGVEKGLINNYGAVSCEVASAMAEKVRKNANSDIGIGITGIAGPTGGTKDKPVGTVFIAISNHRNTKCTKYHFRGERKKVQMLSAYYALNDAIGL
ncbi:competence/damage-inducible protein A [Candidatus Margulisiibacteriota bacterium]